MLLGKKGGIFSFSLCAIRERRVGRQEGGGNKFSEKEEEEEEELIGLRDFLFPFLFFHFRLGSRVADVFFSSLFPFFLRRTAD